VYYCSSYGGSNTVLF
nr:immunoglobulin light chain junction region [Macaca mulatta]MOW66483.1 immunoglobulin light chain junction region [Macaca mulatta]MOW66653.1 immunoglobulin light chain junction region [Macaca mulatta]MOW67638.1 immunoglobulin light chain junction region [Macaca mulatta]MOW67901.1 immunoglobulin light chain junction region [Macaca mulatta]